MIQMKKNWIATLLIPGLLVSATSKTVNADQNQLPQLNYDLQKPRSDQQRKAIPQKIRISVMTPDGPNDEEQGKICGLMILSVGQAMGYGFKGECGKFSNREEINQARDSGEYRFHFLYNKLPDNSISVTAEYWHKLDESEPDNLSWRIANKPAKTQEEALQLILKDFFEGINEADLRKQRHLKMALDAIEDAANTGKPEEPSRIKHDKNTGKFFDSFTRKIISPRRAYQIFIKEDKRHLKYARTALEITGLLGVGAYMYYAPLAEENAIDWKYGFNEKSFKERFITGEGWRFDDNNFYYNNPGHPIAGALYYSIARHNGLSALESLGFAIFGSSSWEAFMEFREVISITDQIFTPLSGAIIGETLYQCSQFHARGKRNIFNMTAYVACGGPGAISQILFGEVPEASGSYDRFGFPDDVFHEFEVGTGVGATLNHSTGQGRADGVVNASGKILLIPGAGKEGTFSKLSINTMKVESKLHAKFGQAGVNDFEAYAKAVLGGFYIQDLKKKGCEGSSDEKCKGQLHGYSILLGVASKYKLVFNRADHLIYQKASLKDDGLQKIGVANILGPSIELAYMYNGFKVEATIDVYGNFAAIRSLAIDKWNDHHGLDGATSVMRERRYHYALGVTVNPGLKVSYQEFEWGGSLNADLFDSSATYMKDQKSEEVTNPLHAQDLFMRSKIWAGYTLPSDLMKLQVSLENIHRDSRIEDFGVQDTATTAMFDVIIKF